MIDFPEILSENDVTVFTILGLKEHIPHLRTEVIAKFENSDKRHCRFDIVGYDENKSPIFVIEVKRRYKDPLKEIDQDGLKQVRDYRELLDIPVYLIRGIRHAQQMIPKILDEANRV